MVNEKVKKFDLKICRSVRLIVLRTLQDVRPTASCMNLHEMGVTDDVKSFQVPVDGVVESEISNLRIWAMLHSVE